MPYENIINKGTIENKFFVNKELDTESKMPLIAVEGGKVQRVLVSRKAIKINKVLNKKIKQVNNQYIESTGYSYELFDLNTNTRVLRTEFMLKTSAKQYPVYNFNSEIYGEGELNAPVINVDSNFLNTLTLDNPNFDNYKETVVWVDKTGLFTIKKRLNSFNITAGIIVGDTFRLNNPLIKEVNIVNCFNLNTVEIINSYSVYIESSKINKLVTDARNIKIVGCVINDMNVQDYNSDIYKYNEKYIDLILNNISKLNIKSILDIYVTLDYIQIDELNIESKRVQLGISYSHKFGYSYCYDNIINIDGKFSNIKVDFKQIKHPNNIGIANIKVKELSLCALTGSVFNLYTDKIKKIKCVDADELNFKFNLTNNMTITDNKYYIDSDCNTKHNVIINKITCNGTDVNNSEASQLLNGITDVHFLETIKQDAKDDKLIKRRIKTELLGEEDIFNISYETSTLQSVNIHKLSEQSKILTLPDVKHIGVYVFDRYSSPKNIEIVKYPASLEDKILSPGMTPNVKKLVFRTEIRLLNRKVSSSHVDINGREGIVRNIVVAQNKDAFKVKIVNIEKYDTTYYTLMDDNGNKKEVGYSQLLTAMVYNKIYVTNAKLYLDGSIRVRG